MSRQINQTEITRYLLGALSDEERASLEERYFSDDAAFEEIEIAEEELIDQYVRGELSNEDSERFGVAVAKSPRLAERVEFARVWKAKVAASGVAVEPAEKPLEPKRGWGKHSRPKSTSVSIRYLAMAASVLVLVGVGFFVWRTFIYEPPIERGLEALQAAYAKQRPVEARVSGFRYAPLGNQRGGEVAFDYIQHDRAANILLSEARAHATAESLHALGRYYIFERKFDDAIVELEKAVILAPNNAMIRSDLGVAWLEKGIATGDASGRGVETRDLLQSREQLSKALELNSLLPEALFNRAICYDYIQEPDNAAQDLQKFLQLEPSSSWSTEARDRLKRLRR